MDSEAGGLLTSSAFDEANVRRGFMRKVYSILSLQLLVTMAVMGIFFIEPVKIYSRTDGQWMFWVAFVASMVCIIALTCFEGVRRKAPGNLVWLGVFTLGKISQVFKFFSSVHHLSTYAQNILFSFEMLKNEKVGENAFSVSILIMVLRQDFYRF